MATTLEEMTLQDLVTDSTHVIHAACVSTRVERGDDGLIRTFAEVLVAETAKGEPIESLEIILPGGQIGDEGQIVIGVPRLTAGQELVLFVQMIAAPSAPSAVNAIPMAYVTGLSQGAFRLDVDADGRRQVRRDLAGARLVTGTGGESLYGEPFEMDLEPFLEQVRDAVAAAGGAH